MRKYILMALGAAITLAAPQLASATPLSLGLAAAADTVSGTEEVRHRRRHRRWHRHHRHCVHSRHWSGRRCR